MPFKTFTAGVARIRAPFPGSGFVRKTVGVGSVSGPAAWLLSRGQLLKRDPARAGRHYYFGSFTLIVKRNQVATLDFAGNDDDGSD